MPFDGYNLLSFCRAASWHHLNCIAGVKPILFFFYTVLYYTVMSSFGGQNASIRFFVAACLFCIEDWDLQTLDWGLHWLAKLGVLNNLFAFANPMKLLLGPLQLLVRKIPIGKIASNDQADQCHWVPGRYQKTPHFVPKNPYLRTI